MFRINNEILLDFIHCQYKAYRKSKQQKGIVSDYEILYCQLKQAQKINFEKSISENSKPILHQVTFDGTIPKDSIALDFNFKNENIDLTIDGVEFTGKKRFMPIFITPFEKVTRANKLFIALQSAFIQNEFNLQVENCKVIFGKGLRQTKFKSSSFAKGIKKEVGVMGKILSNSSAPQFFRNNHCQVCEFQQNCLEKFIERDDLSLLTGLKLKEIQQKNNRGIFSVKQLSYSFRPKKNPYRKRKFLPELKALAVREGKTFIQEIPTIPISSNDVFLDIEGIPDRNFYYLIGAIVKTNDAETNYSFWANDESEEQKIFLELFTLLQSLGEFTILHYGSYEIQALKKISKALSLEHQEFVSKVIESSFNLLTVFMYNIYPPTFSNSLKDIARFIKFDWTEKDASGLQSIVWRCNWEITKDIKLKHKLIQYNIEDSKALLLVNDWIKTIDKSEVKTQMTSTLKLENIFKWGVTVFALDHFNEINSRAYFEYQREHIFLRTERKVYKALVKGKLNSKRFNKVDKKIDLFPKKCFKCKSKELKIIRSSKKTQLDLIFMKQGIKKQSIEYTGGAFWCCKCRKNYMVRDMKILPQYGNNLMLWCVNQKIQYRLSSEHIINLLKDSFRIEVSATQMTRFKEIVARRYFDTYKEIIFNICASSLIHTDETIARIKGIDGYVWVFANHENVYYEFRETREPDFLKVLLKDFKGVLVSDFYTGYDSLECKQQKCLIHLIRDLNEGFLKHQFDIELKAIVIEFGNLLRSIIATIDKFGLKQIHLNKHKKDVEKFYSNVIYQRFESEFVYLIKKDLPNTRKNCFNFWNAIMSHGIIIMPKIQ